MKPGRNDPCPCGSGLKYKKCCLARDEAEATRDRPAETADPAWRQRAFSRLVKFIERPDLGAEARAALRRFVEPERFRDEGDPERLAGAVETSQASFLFWFCFDHLLRTGRTPVQAFLAAEGERLSARERAHLERLGQSRVGLYEIQEVHRDRGLRVLDLATGAEVEVRERAGTHHLVRFDLLAVRLVPFEDGVLEIEGPVILFQPRHKPALLDLIRKHRRASRRRAAAEPAAFAKAPAFAVAVHEAWIERSVFPALPRFVTVEGEPVIFARSLFDVRGNAGAIRATLDRHPALERQDDDYSWGEATEDGRRTLGRVAIEDGRLVLETVSRGRAERGRALLEAALGDSIRHRATRLEDPHRAAAAVRGKRPRDEDANRLPADVEARLLAEYKDRYYRKWLDEPVPALGGRTPRQAARLKTGRARLIDLLKEFENMEARAAQDGEAPCDFSWLWTELGLTR